MRASNPSLPPPTYTYIYFAFYRCDKHYDHKQLGRKGFISSYILYSIMEENHTRKLEAELEDEAMKDQCLPGLFTLLCI